MQENATNLKWKQKKIKEEIKTIQREGNGLSGNNKTESLNSVDAHEQWKGRIPTIILIPE